jgi:hypothetical protein
MRLTWNPYLASSLIAVIHKPMELGVWSSVWRVVISICTFLLCVNSYSDVGVAKLWAHIWQIYQNCNLLATAWTIGVLGFDSRRGLGIFLLSTPSRPALGPTNPPIQWVLGALSPGIKRPGHEADHSSPSSAEVKEWLALYFHPPVRLHSVVLS